MFEQVQTWKDDAPWAETAMQWAVNMSTVSFPPYALVGFR